MSIKDVSDTALWVATYRAKESTHPKAIFKDPYIGLLITDEGEEIAQQSSDSKYVSWTVVIRTHVI